MEWNEKASPNYFVDPPSHYEFCIFSNVFPSISFILLQCLIIKYVYLYIQCLYLVWLCDVSVYKKSLFHSLFGWFFFLETAQQHMGTTGCDVETTTYQWYVKTIIFFFVCCSLLLSEYECITTCNISNNVWHICINSNFCCEISETYMHM